MTVTASVTDNVQLISASILDAVQQVMDDNVIIGSLNLVSVKKLVFLGDTMEQAKAGSTSSGGPIPLPPAGGGGGGNSSSEANKTPNAPVNTALAVGIPVALLSLLALLLLKNKRRNVVTASEALALEGEDYVLVGTGDPPRSFHEGLYHYTRGGARYLSTNCKDCAETRMNGFFTDADLPTITEGRLYDPASPSLGSSYDSQETETSGENASNTTGETGSDLRLVRPNSKNLGFRHSRMDVHHCTSATCKICNGYKSDDVSFISSPPNEENSAMLNSEIESSRNSQTENPHIALDTVSSSNIFSFDSDTLDNRGKGGLGEGTAL